MRIITCFTIIVSILSFGLVLAQDAKVDFSGEWALNAEKSEMGGDSGGGRGGRRGMGYSKMVVEQSENKLVVNAYRQNRDGEEVVTASTYTLDGKECENAGNFGTRISVAKWAKDGKSLVINSTMTGERGGEQFTMESSETWSIQDGNLVIESVRSTPRGERQSKTVYDKVVKE